MSWWKRIAVLFLVVIAFPTSAVAQPKYVLEAVPTSDIEAVLTYSIQAPRLRAKEWVVVLARPIDLPSQTGVQSQVEPQGRGTNDFSTPGRPLWEVRVLARNADLEKALTVRVNYRARLFARKLSPLAAGAKLPAVAPLTERERELYLMSTAHYDFGSTAFKEWMRDQRLLRGGQEGDVEFARRALLAARTTLTYQYPTRTAVASGVCREGRSHCGGLSAVFVAALRANGIPARCLVGRWADSLRPGTDQCHVKAEFFAEAVGWVPVEVSGAVSFKNNDLDNFLGNDQGDHLTLHVDTDVLVDSVHFGKKPIEWLQTGVYWVTSTAGVLDGSSTKDDWQVRKFPVPPSELAAELRKQGTELIRKGHYQAALDQLTKAIQENSKDALAYHERGVAHTFVKNDTEAIADFTRALALNDRSAITWRSRGSAYLRMDKYAEALVDFNRAIQIDPNYVLAYRGRSAVYRKMGKSAEADEDDRRANKLQEAKEKGKS